MGEVDRKKGGEGVMNKIKTRQKKEKLLLLEQLQRIPIIQIACEKAGIGRATYYRWRKEDMVFAEKADEALFAGERIINDMAESQLLGAIRDNNLTAIIFWLKNHHKSYSTKVEINAVHKIAEGMSQEQEKMVQKALELTGISSGQKEGGEP